MARRNTSRTGGEDRAVREALAQRLQLQCAIIYDWYRGSSVWHCPAEATRRMGERLVLTTDCEYKSEDGKPACSYEKLPQSVQPGHQILVADGSLAIDVQAMAARRMWNVHCWPTAPSG